MLLIWMVDQFVALRHKEQAMIYSGTVVGLARGRDTTLLHVERAHNHESASVRVIEGVVPVVDVGDFVSWYNGVLVCQGEGEVCCGIELDVVE